MCGIGGFTGTPDNKLLARMMRVLAHRGPDGHGNHVDNNVSLGHQRLSIIDVKGGKQPIYNEEGTTCVVFNGEIYNYKELRKELEQHKHAFTTNTDTEVLVHAYEQWGDLFVQKLNGDFALAIWDSTQKKLLLARDRFGIKPLYYTQTKERFLFASEIKSLLQDDAVPREINRSAIPSYLTFRCNHRTDTLFHTIHKVPPATLLTLQNGSVTTRKYWTLTYNTNTSITKEAAADTLLDLLRQSVQRRLMSEVPLGVFLSGGMDSMSIVALMNEHAEQGQIKTYSAGFGISEHDELPKAQLVADTFHTDHHTVSIETRDAATLPAVLWHMDEAVSDPTCLAVYALARTTKPTATVVLTGEGGDELFGGYEQQGFMQLHKKTFGTLPTPLRKAVAPAIGLIPPGVLNVFFKYARDLGSQGVKRMKAFVTGNTPAERYLSMVSIFDEMEKRDLLAKPGLTSYDEAALVTELNGIVNKQQELLHGVLDLDIHTVFAENFLMKTDKNCMAFGVEGRVPYLDHTVADFAATLPPSFKRNDTLSRLVFKKSASDKIILREAMKPLVPNLPPKSRFFVPINYWFESELMDVAKQVLDTSRLERHGVLNPAAVERVFAGFKKSPLYYSRQLWSLMSLELWQSMYIDENRCKPPNGFGDVI